MAASGLWAASLVVQIDGKTRSRISVPVTLDNEEFRVRALWDAKVAAALMYREVIRTVVVPPGVVNFVTRK